jgi:hypothetical protein
MAEGKPDDEEDLTLAEAAARLGRNLELVRVWVASGRSRAASAQTVGS